MRVMVLAVIGGLGVGLVLGFLAGRVSRDRGADPWAVVGVERPIVRRSDADRGPVSFPKPAFPGDAPVSLSGRVVQVPAEKCEKSHA